MRFSIELMLMIRGVQSAGEDRLLLCYFLVPTSNDRQLCDGDNSSNGKGSAIASRRGTHKIKTVCNKPGVLRRDLTSEIRVEKVPPKRTEGSENSATSTVEIKERAPRQDAALSQETQKPFAEWSAPATLGTSVKIQQYVKQRL